MSKRNRLQLAFAATWRCLILFQIFTKKLNLKIWKLFFLYISFQNVFLRLALYCWKYSIVLAGFIHFFDSSIHTDEMIFLLLSIFFYWKSFQLTFTQTGKFYLCLCPGIPLPCRFPQSIQLFGKTSDGRQKWKFHQGHVINCKGCQIMKMTILPSWNYK